MKAVIYEKYGPPEVLHLVDIPKPTPKANEVLIKIYATTVTIGDSRMRSFTVPRAMWIPARLYLGIRGPKRKILGMEIAGEIEAVGQDVTRFKPGDPVFASTFDADWGGYAEYKCLPETDLLAIKPSNLSYEEAAAAVGGGMTALRCLTKAKLQRGQNVLIYGASGAVGTNAVQLASRHFGAEVTGVCSTANLELVKALGAHHVIDYTREDFTRESYDLVFDAVGKLKARPKATIYLNVNKDSGSGTRKEEFLALKDLLEAGTVNPVIDRCYSLDQIVEAHRYVDAGHKKGNVAITIGGNI